MEEKELKTSTGQRIAILLIAFIMLGSIIAGYVAIVASGNSASKTGDTVSEITEEKKAEYEAAYEEKKSEFAAATKSEYDTFKNYLGEVREYDESAANSNGVTTKELYEGSGRELAAGDTDYAAYYVGWCADGTVFDSSLDDASNPTMFVRTLEVSGGLIKGWQEGVVGMKLGGVRRITMPGEKAYGESMEICGGYSKPLRFLVMAVERDEEIMKLSNEFIVARMRKEYADYGIDYGA